MPQILMLTFPFLKKELVLPPIFDRENNKQSVKKWLIADDAMEILFYTTFKDQIHSVIKLNENFYLNKDQ